MTSLLRHREDLPQVLRALLSPFLLLVPFFGLPENVGLQVLLWFAIWLPTKKLNYVLHNHIHVPFTTSRRFNRIIDWALGFCTGMTASNWRLTHVHGHHVEHLWQVLPSREHLFRYMEFERHYTFLNCTIHSLRSAGPQWFYPLRDGWEKGIRGRGFRKAYYSYMFWEIVGIYSIVAALAVINLKVTFWFFLFPYALVYFFSRYVDYITHVSVNPGQRYGYSTVCLSPWYNRGFWNFGYHIVHHEQPKLHWTELPHVFEQMHLEPDPEAEEVTVWNYASLFLPPVLKWRPFRAIAEQA